MRMKKLDRFLNGQDVAVHSGVAVINHGRESGGFTGAGGANHKNKPAWPHNQCFQDRWQFQCFQRRNGGLNVTDHHADFAALNVEVYPEAPNGALADREIQLQVGFEFRLLFFVDQAIGELFHLARLEHLVADRCDLALDLDIGSGSGAEEQVGCVLLHQLSSVCAGYKVVNTVIPSTVPSLLLGR